MKDTVSLSLLNKLIKTELAYKKLGIFKAYSLMSIYYNMMRVISFKKNLCILFLLYLFILARPRDLTSVTRD